MTPPEKFWLLLRSVQKPKRGVKRWRNQQAVRAAFGRSDRMSLWNSGAAIELLTARCSPVSRWFSSPKKARQLNLC